MSGQKNRARCVGTKGLRPGLCAASLVGLILALLVGGAVYAHAAFWPDPTWRAPTAPLLQHVESQKKPAASKQKVRPDTYSWMAVREKSNLKLRGSVPSEEDRRTILGMVKANFPDLEVEDKLRVDVWNHPENIPHTSGGSLPQLRNQAGSDERRLSASRCTDDSNQ